MMTVTVPGTSIDVTLTLGSGDSAGLAAQISALLATIQGAGNLIVTTDITAPAATTPGSTTELLLTPTLPTINNFIPPDTTMSLPTAGLAPRRLWPGATPSSSAATTAVSSSPRGSAPSWLPGGATSLSPTAPTTCPSVTCPPVTVQTWYSAWARAL